MTAERLSALLFLAAWAAATAAVWALTDWRWALLAVAGGLAAAGWDLARGRR